MKKIAIGIITGIVLMIIFYYSQDEIIEKSIPFFLGVFLVLSLVSAFLLILFLLFKDSISFRTPILDNNKDEIIKEILPNISDEAVSSISEIGKKYAISRSIVFGVSVITSFIVIIGGLIGSALLIKQNSLIEEQTIRLDNQNDLIGIQNHSISIQNILSESDRRSSLVFLFANIMDSLNDELERPDNKNRKLSPQLIARIVALAQRLQPYKYLQNGELTKESISPERSQLFISLVKSNINDKDLNKILSEGNFGGMLISNTSFKNLDLDVSRMSSAKFLNSKFTDVALNGSLSKLRLNNLNAHNFEYNSGEVSLSNFDIKGTGNIILNNLRVDSSSINIDVYGIDKYEYLIEIRNSIFNKSTIELSNDMIVLDNLNFQDSKLKINVNNLTVNYSIFTDLTKLLIRPHGYQDSVYLNLNGLVIRDENLDLLSQLIDTSKALILDFSNGFESLSSGIDDISKYSIVYYSSLRGSTKVSDIDLDEFFYNRIPLTHTINKYVLDSSLFNIVPDKVIEAYKLLDGSDKRIPPYDDDSRDSVFYQMSLSQINQWEELKYSYPNLYGKLVQYCYYSWFYFNLKEKSSFIKKEKMIDNLFLLQSEIRKIQGNNDYFILSEIGYTFSDKRKNTIIKSNYIDSFKYLFEGLYSVEE